MHPPTPKLIADAARPLTPTKIHRALCSCPRDRNVRPNAGALLDQVPRRGIGKCQRRDTPGRCVKTLPVFSALGLF